MPGFTPTWAQQLFAWLLSKLSPAVHEYARPWREEAFAQVFQGPVKHVVEVGKAPQLRDNTQADSFGPLSLDQCCLYVFICMQHQVLKYSQDLLIQALEGGRTWMSMLSSQASL